MPAAATMNPTYIGYVGSTKDALLVIQAVLNGQLLAVPRRPHDRERTRLISSGNVFVFIEERSGIRRWTDGVAWSPSRILGRFLVYRELDRGALSSKDARSCGARGSIASTGSDKSSKRSRRMNSDALPMEIGSTGPPPVIGSSFSSASSSGSANSIPGTGNVSSNTGTDDLQSSNSGVGSSNRSLVGSLVASYAFKEYGLIKKTMSLTVQRLDTQSQNTVVETIHLVSYYAAEDVLSGKFMRPVDTPSLKDVQLSNDLWTAVKETSLGGKVPAEEAFYFMDATNSTASTLIYAPHSQSSLKQEGGVLPQQQAQDSTNSHNNNSSSNAIYNGAFGYSGHQFAAPPNSQQLSQQQQQLQLQQQQQQQQQQLLLQQQHQYGSPFQFPPPVPNTSHRNGGSTSSESAATQQPQQQAQSQPYMNDLNLPLYGQGGRFTQPHNYNGMQTFAPMSFNPHAGQPIQRASTPDSSPRVKTEVVYMSQAPNAGYTNSNVGGVMNYSRMNNMEGPLLHQNFSNPVLGGNSVQQGSSHGMNAGHSSSGGLLPASNNGNHYNGNIIGGPGGKWVSYDDAQQQHHPHQQQPQQPHGYVTGFPAGSGGNFGPQLH